MSPPPAHTSARELAAWVRAGGSAEQLIEQRYQAIRLRDPAINSVRQLLLSRALARARDIDGQVSRGIDPGPLAGVPFGAKELFDVRHLVTLAGSRVRATAPAAERDAAAIERLEAAGAILLATLNMDEFAYGFTCENAHYGATRNPHDLGRIAGGSSGGSAAVVAASLLPLSLGSDTNGSIRVPAALCGVFGLKPTYGRVSRRGSFPFVDSLDHVGPFARNARDLAVAFDALQGPDSEDPVCASRPADTTAFALEEPLGALRVAVLGGWFAQSAESGALQAVQRVAHALGATQTVQLDEAGAARAAAFCLSAAEGGALHLPALRRDAAVYDPATRDRLLAGALQPARIITQAQRMRRLFLRQALQQLQEFEVLLAPSTPFAATPVGEAHTILQGQRWLVRAGLGLYTQPLSFIGLPVLSVPVVMPGSLPLGVQLIAAPWQERRLLQLAAWLEDRGIIAAPQSAASNG